MAIAIGLVPVAVNHNLRETYIFTLSHYAAKIHQPDIVLVGDSITAGGGHSLTGWGSINKATNGLTARQITGLAKEAYATYHPRNLLVMAGTNDVLSPWFRQEETKADLANLVESVSHLTGTNVVLTLIPPTTNATLNQKISELNSFLRDNAFAHKIAIVDLWPELAPKGVLLQKFSLDGVHISEPAYAIWRDKIEQAIQSSHMPD